MPAACPNAVSGPRPDLVQRDSRGRRGFGHTQDRRQVVPAEAELILEAAQRVLGGTTLSSIVDDWNRRGVTTTTGGPWRINALSALLIQPRLTGRNPSSASNDATTTNRAADESPDQAVPAILDETTHEALLALRHARRKTMGPGPQKRSARRYLLTGFLRCWRCGSRLGGIAPRTTTVQPHYRCPSRGAGGCSGVVVHASHAEDAARDAVIARVDDPAFVDSVACREAVLAAEEATMTAVVADAVMGRSLNGGGSDDGGDGGAVSGLWTEGHRIDGDAWGKLKDVLEAKARVGGSELASQTVVGRQRELCGTGARLRTRWDGMDLEERRSVLEAIVDHFVVLPAPRLRSQFTADRLQPVWKG